MRNGVKESPILNQTMVACAKIIAQQLIHSGRENERNTLCDETVSSPVVSNYLKNALDLIEYAYVPEYIDVILEYEYQKIDKSCISLEELKALTILNKVATRVLQKKDIDFFYEFFSHECPSEIRDELIMMLKCSDSQNG